MGWGPQYPPPPNQLQRLAWEHPMLRPNPRALSQTPLLPTACSRRQQYAASRKLLGLAGVKLRQHRFARRFVLDLGPDP